MRVLVTGGLGFVGINLVYTLAGQPDVEVVAGDRLPWDEQMARFLAPVQGRIRAVPLDVRDPSAIAGFVQQEQITHIVHAAAITVGGDAERAMAPEIVAVNLGGAIAVLNAALSAPRVERVLLVSSSGVYGAPHPGHTGLQPEDGRLDLSSLYTITKHSAELLATRYSMLAGKPMASVRLPSVYGPMERALASRPATSVVCRLMDALRAGRPLRVAGPAVAGDWSYAPEIGTALWALLSAPSWRHTVYNASYGQPVSLREIVDAFSAHGLAARWIDDPARADVAMLPRQERAPLDISRLRADTDFEPRYDFRRGLAEWLASGAV